jgi:hypothetical protein
MNPLAAFLLLAVVVTHFGYDPLCAVFPSLEHAAKGLFYVFRGVEGVVLFAVIAYLRPVLLWVCAFGAIEEGETAVCRLVAGPLDRPPVATAWSGLCGDVSHLPLYMLGIVVTAVLITRKNKP